MDGTSVAAGAEHDGEDHRSRWPFVAAAGAAMLYGGGGLLMASGGLLPDLPLFGLAGAGVLVLLVGLFGWTYEAFIDGYRSDAVGEDASLYVGGMWLFLLSDLATFAAGFVYYGFVRAGTWPPSELPPLLSSLVLVNTLLLVLSSVTIHLAHGALERGEGRRFLGLLGATFLLGVVFLGGQALEYYEFVVHEGFALSSGVFASAFYGLTGLHGLHVALGVVLFGLLLVRGFRGHYSAERDTSIRTVALYWHFVDGVWLFLVAVLYVGAAVG